MADAAFQSPRAAPPYSERPTRVRYGVLAFACTLSMITYLDRVCIASAAKEFASDLGLKSVADLKWAFAAFALAYSLFEVPSGWLGDVFGPRNVLIRIVLWWSAFTALTALVGIVAWDGLSLFSADLPWYGPVTVGLGWMTVLVVVRFLFGMGEAGAYPNITRSLHNWFPFQERGFAQGAVWMSGRLMGGLTPALWTVLVAGISITVVSESGQEVQRQLWPQLIHWRAAFWLFGGLGVLWCLLFMWRFRNRPEEKPSVNAAELTLIRGGGAESESAHAGIPWGRILLSGNLWILCLMYACQAYGWYFYITYLPTFMREQHGVQDDSFLGALYKGGPLWLGAAGCLIGGLATDLFIRLTGNRRLGRRLFGLASHALTGLCFFALYLLGSPDPQSRPDPFWFFLAISLAGFFTDLAMGPAWAVCQDIGKRYAAIVAGFMNMVGNFGGFVASCVTGYVINLALARHAARLGAAVEKLSDAEKVAGEFDGYQLNFLIFAAVYAVGVLCWLGIDATKPVAPEEPPARQ